MARYGGSAQNEEYEVNSFRAHSHALVGSRPPVHGHPAADVRWALELQALAALRRLPTLESSRLLEVRFVDLIQGKFVRDASHRQAGDLGRAADAAPGFSQGPTQIPLLECSDHLGELVLQRS